PIRFSRALAECAGVVYPQVNPSAPARASLSLLLSCRTPESVGNPLRGPVASKEDSEALHYPIGSRRAQSDSGVPAHCLANGMYRMHSWLFVVFAQSVSPCAWRIPLRSAQ